MIPQLEAALVDNSAHIAPGAVGTHVLKIQLALETLEQIQLPSDEKDNFKYGPETADAVLHYKSIRRSINFAIEQTADNIVGERTIASMDADLVAGGDTRGTQLSVAHRASRESLDAVHTRLQGLRDDIVTAAALSEPERTFEAGIVATSHARDLQVLSRRLVVSADPLDNALRQGISATIDLITQNLAQPVTVIDEGVSGRCGVFADPPFAASVASDPDPKVSVCDPFFASAADLRRDIVTHEYFHLIGLEDHSVTNLAEALTNANTIAQIVAFLFDRDRQVNSDGNEAAVPPFPSP
ncbi:hypothetical protein IU450_28095 [Nocardia abscessus]|uniref:hypothetical protein n=1 Tax=Nocardia abscessus TaxID=120957 RepID=UPI001893B6BD|nr:hypothetical protein [Nocardia abscessus]MBF6339724.1 hypothetical protein [Nocardia abscessus]